MATDRATERAPLLEVRGLTKHFPVTRGLMGTVVGQVRAVDDVSFDLQAGETLGLVGESGCGKTTTGRAILRLIEPTSGTLRFEGRDITQLSRREMLPLRRNMQIIFQDPFSSLNPRMRVFDIVGEAIEVHGLATGAAVEERVVKLLQRVGIAPSWVHRYPHEFSGGQRQRIGIARALALGPKLIVCDEAVSALDVSIRAQVINLLIELREELNLSYLFIAHDLSVVQHICQRVAVMYLGQIVELSDTASLFASPAHPYTRALLSAVPVPNPRVQVKRTVLQGDVPTPLNPPNGCRFHTRCPLAFDRCRHEEPPLLQIGKRQVKCFLASETTS
jgi:oligopeptide/dipeptide ABC transporter ATP-binding protein